MGYRKPFKILLLISLILFSGTATSWWNQNWEYRKPINVTEESGENLENYQIRLNLDTSSLITDGKLQSDCSDIRFTNSTGLKLDYWLEKGCNTDSTVLWVEIPSLLSGSREKIYVYYGNSDAPPKSSGFRTFPMFDDFERSNIGNNWTKYGDTGYWSISNGRLRADDTNGEGYSYIANTQHEFNNESGLVIGSKIYYSGSAEWGGFLLWSDLNAHHHIDFNPTRYQDRTEAAQDYEQPPDPPVNQGEWYDVKISYNDSDGTLYWFNNDRFAYKESATGVNSPTSGYTGIISNYYYDHVLWEYIYTRKFTSSEPSTSIGTQQNASICDKRGPRNECVVNTNKKVSERIFSIENTFISEKSSIFRSESGLGRIKISNSSVLSGLWTGHIDFSSKEIRIKPGATFRPDNHILLNETS